MRSLFLCVVGLIPIVIVVGDAACAQQENQMTFTVRSPAFHEGERIPRQHTCDGADLSPALTWTDPPVGTKALALIVDDPDAPVGTWVHWVLYNLPPESRQLSEGVPQQVMLDNGVLQGLNDFGRPGYGGPCPPPGPAHRYVFKLHALDAPVSLPPRATKAQLESAIKGHSLAQAQLIGRYQR